MKTENTKETGRRAVFEARNVREYLKLNKKMKFILVLFLFLVLFGPVFGQTVEPVKIRAGGIEFHYIEREQGERIEQNKRKEIIDRKPYRATIDF